MLIAGSVGGSTIGLLGGGEPLLILPPEIAETFHRGDCTKAQVKAAIFERAVMPLNRLSSAVRLHLATLRSCSPDIDADAALRVARKPDDVMIVVAGGVGVKAAYMPTWSSTRAVSRAVSGIVTLRR